MPHAAGKVAQSLDRTHAIRRGVVADPPILEGIGASSSRAGDIAPAPVPVVARRRDAQDPAVDAGGRTATLNPLGWVGAARKGASSREGRPRGGPPFSAILRWLRPRPTRRSSVR